MKTPLFTRGAVAVLAMLASAAAFAGPVGYQGQFGQDDDRFVLQFSLGGDVDLQVDTTSFAQGGFAPVLSLFGPGGLLQLAAGSSHACGAGDSADPATGFCWDAHLDTRLVAGSYTLVLTQDGNLPLGSALADGFAQDGQPDYTGAWFLGQAGLGFINADGSARTGDWAFTLEGTAVPEPATWGLTALALLALGATRRPRRG